MLGFLTSMKQFGFLKAVGTMVMEFEGALSFDLLVAKGSTIMLFHVF